MPDPFDIVFLCSSGSSSANPVGSCSFSKREGQRDRKGGVHPAGCLCDDDDPHRPGRLGKGVKPIVLKEISRYQLRPKTGTQYHLCPEKDIETALDLAEIRIPNPRSTVYVPGRTYTFLPGEEITPDKIKTLLDSLSYCGEFELVKVP